MSQVSSTGATAASNNSVNPENGLNELNVDDFLELLITEMQNQDPLNPMENTEMIQQISQIREIGATNSLTETLSNLSVSQQLTTASSLIGREISGLSDDLEEISGTVERVTVDTESGGEGDRNVKVHIGDKTIGIRNVREILEA